MISPDFLSALSALAGTFVGGFTSVFTTWIGHIHQSKTEKSTREKSERQALYKQFIQEASSLYADSFEHEQTEIPRFIGIYATLNFMRILSTEEVIVEADKVLRDIIETYPKRKVTFKDLVALDHDDIDRLRSFAEACRSELRLR